MTGFGRAQAEHRGVRIAVTAQSVNHRYADFVFRLPERLRALEADLRPRVAERIARGRCEIAVRIEEGARADRFRLDRAALARFLDDARELAALGPVEPRLTLGDLLRSPFVVADGEIAGEADGAERAAEEEAVAAALDAALAELAASRAAEGERLAAALGAGAARLERLVVALAERRAAAAAERAASLRRRLDQLLPGGAEAVPAERLAQELVLLAERSDVEEELERLRGHLAAFAEALGGEGAAGKRLDFLVQEIQRELGTLGAKARDLALTRLVVDAKVVTEQLREQIQNVE
jgi:uncharacterized protein (TIGR00255 family)